MTTQQAPNERIITRIQKLLRLAESKNENEAAEALAKATELMQQHNLEMESVKEFSVQVDDEIEGHFVNLWEVPGVDKRLAKSSNRWVDLLAKGIAQNNFCRVIYHGDAVRFIGRKSNAEVCSFMFSSIVIRLMVLMKEATKKYIEDYKREYGLHPFREHERMYDSDATYRMDYHRAFLQAAASVIYLRLHDQRDTFTATGPEAKALIVTRENEVDEWVKENYSKLGKARSGSSHHGDGYAAGKRAGLSLPIQQGVTGSKVATKLLK